jgi:DNA-binding CsgD family transcriptional regulator/ketosteroid isomerase-like protein
MSEDEDKAAVLAVLEAETAAWMRRDMDALAEQWVHSIEARRMSSVAHRGSQVQEGWDAINTTLRSLAEQYPQSFAETRVRHERMNIVVNGDTAWVTYNQVGEKADDGFELAGTQHELKIFHRTAGQWKIACIVVLQRTIDQEICPLIEITADKRVLWMNGYAHELMINNPFLVVSGGRLRALNRAYDADLQNAVDWASRHLHWSAPLSQPSHRAHAVILGEGDNAAPLFCWVLVEDGKILVSFNDDQMVKRRVALAQDIYGLTAAQAQVAQLLAQGHDPSLAAEKLGISINTVRTHVRRMFDKTGARSQSALVGLLLSAEAPTAR